MKRISRLYAALVAPLLASGCCCGHSWLSSSYAPSSPIYANAPAPNAPPAPYYTPAATVVPAPATVTAAPLVSPPAVVAPPVVYSAPATPVGCPPCPCTCP